MSDDEDHVRSLLKGLRLLECFSSAHPELSLTDFVKLSGYSKTTTYRLLRTLEAAGWLERTPTGMYRLTLRAFQLGSLVIEDLQLRREALPIIQALAAELAQTIFLVVPDGVNAVCLERIDGDRGVRIMDLAPGGSQALNLGAAPRALLAFRATDLLGPRLAAGLPKSTPNSVADEAALLSDLAKIRESGYSVGDQDMTLGVYAVGTPVFDRTGSAIAAISAGGLAERLDGDARERMKKAVLAAAQAISARMGYVDSVGRQF